MVQGAWCRVQGAGFRVQGAGCRVTSAGSSLAIAMMNCARPLLSSTCDVTIHGSQPFSFKYMYVYTYVYRQARRERGGGGGDGVSESEAHTLVAGEVGDVRSARGGGGRAMSFSQGPFSPSPATPPRIEGAHTPVPLLFC